MATMHRGEEPGTRHQEYDLDEFYHGVFMDDSDAEVRSTICGHGRWAEGHMNMHDLEIYFR